MVIPMMNMTDIITMSTESGFLRLLQATDSLFPIGAFTLSGGMETYTSFGIVGDMKSLLEFLDSYIYLLPYNDAGFAAKSAMGENHVFLDALYTASRSPYELRNGSSKLCARFIKAECALGNYVFLKKYGEDISAKKCSGSFPVAMGLFIRETGADVKTGLEMYIYSLLSATVNHAVKLVPLRQLDGQKCLGEAVKKIPFAAEKSMNVSLHDLGTGGSGFDLRSMQHEKLYSRIYIS